MTILTILKRDLTLAYRHPIGLLIPLFFFLLVTTLFPLTLSSDPKKLMEIGPAVIWIGFLFAFMLTIEHIFTGDEEDGTLEQMMLHSDNFVSLVLAKIVAHWLANAVPLLLTSFLVSKLFFMQSIKILFLSLLLGSPIFSLIGAIGAGLTIGIGNRSILVILLLLPLYLPVLIFGADAVNVASYGQSVSSQLSFLGAIFVLALTFAPLASAAAIKISLS